MAYVAAGSMVPVTMTVSTMEKKEPTKDNLKYQKKNTFNQALSSFLINLTGLFIMITGTILQDWLSLSYSKSMSALILDPIRADLTILCLGSLTSYLLGCILISVYYCRHSDGDKKLDLNKVSLLPKIKIEDESIAIADATSVDESELTEIGGIY